jgi:4-coumarate--CoA ligase
MKGYWRNERATREVFVDCPDGRWMRTGDIAYICPKGYFYIVDRMKELIKVKGLQVAPAELEALLLEHPQVADAAVIGVTIDGEELPRAYVVLQPDGRGKVQGKEIAEWLAKRVSKHKRLDGGVVFVDSIPKNPVSYSCPAIHCMMSNRANNEQSGKIMRKVLREKAKEEVKDSVRARL